MTHKELYDYGYAVIDRNHRAEHPEYSSGGYFVSDHDFQVAGEAILSLLGRLIRRSERTHDDRCHILEALYLKEFGQTIHVDQLLRHGGYEVRYELTDLEGIKIPWQTILDAISDINVLRTYLHTNKDDQ